MPDCSFGAICPAGTEKALPMHHHPIKNSTDRHELILRKLREKGRVSIETLAKATGVSGVTIRKDLKLLEDKNLLFRIRGGGSLTHPYIRERPIREKEFIHQKEKDLIARAALSLIHPNDSIIIGSGTTAFALARALYPPGGLTVITPAAKVTLELAGRPNVEVFQLGGLIRPNSSSVTGAQPETLLKDISCDTLFLGVDGIDLEFGLSITNVEEASLHKKMIDSAGQVAVLADSTKFGKRGLAKVCDFGEVEYIVTDNGISARTIRQLEERDVTVIVAG